MLAGVLLFRTHTVRETSETPLSRAETTISASFMAPYALFFDLFCPGERESASRSPRPRECARAMPSPGTLRAPGTPLATSCLMEAGGVQIAALSSRRLPTPNSLFYIPVCLLRNPHQPPYSGDRDYVTPRIFVIDDFLGLKRSLRCPRCGRRRAMAPHSRPSSTQSS